MTNTESAMDQLADLSQSVQEESKRRSKRSLDTAMDISEDGSTLKKKKSEQDQHSSQRSLFPIRKENDLKMDTSTSNDFTISDDPEPAIVIVYHPGTPLPKMDKYLGRIIEVRVPAKYLTSRNKEIQTRQIWGTDLYTDDSDIIAILVHSGKYFLRPSPPASIEGIAARLRVLPGQREYEASIRFKLRSRNWNSDYSQYSLQLEDSEAITDPLAFDPSKHPKRSFKALDAPESLVLNRTVRRRFVTDVTIVFNSSNEPALKYCLGLIGDRGMDESQWTSSRLRNEVLYFETGFMSRYELSLYKSGHDSKDLYDTYKLCKVKKESITRPPKNAAIPLKSRSVDEIVKQLDWEEIEWGPASVRIRNQEYPIQSVLFRKRSN